MSFTFVMNNCTKIFIAACIKKKKKNPIKILVLYVEKGTATFFFNYYIC